MRRFGVLPLALLMLPAGGCMTKPRHLVYPDGVTFTGWYVPNFEICGWACDPKNPRPCPLVVHLPAGDLGDKELTDAAALRRAGWEAQANGTLLLRAGAGWVSCTHQGGVLTGVTVSTLTDGGPVLVSIGGKLVALPATDGAVVAALGQPLRRE